MIFRRQAQEDFKVEPVSSPEMDALIERCGNIYRGRPDWIMGPDDHIKTINFAKSICSETARLTTLAIGIQISGSARATWLQEQVEKVYFKIREWVEYGCAYGTVIIKPNGNSLEVFTPADFMIIDRDNLNINGIIFFDHYEQGGKYYTRFEYHRFTEEKDGDRVTYPYYISNKAYVSKSPNSRGDAIPLNQTKWAGMMEESPPITKGEGEKLDGPMFGVLRMPGANNIDIDSPLGLPVFTDAIEEFKDLDVAYSRNVDEIFDSERIVLADDRLMYDSGTPVKKFVGGVKNAAVKIARYVKNVFGNSPQEFYQEINPNLNTETRLAGINSLLSQIGYKCGYSNGYFVFNESTGIATATQIESENQRTVQFIKDIRDKLEECIKGAVYGLSVYADIYKLNPAGNYEIDFDFGEIYYNRQEERERALRLVNSGLMTKEYYLEKYEGFTKQEATEMVSVVEQKEKEKMKIDFFGKEE